MNNLSYFVAVIIVWSLPRLAAAQCVSDTPGGIQNPLNACSITELFRILLSILLIFAVPIIVFFIVYAGFLYVTARGNAETIGRAHKALLYAIVGGLLILGANVLIDVIQGTVDAVRSS